MIGVNAIAHPHQLFKFVATDLLRRTLVKKAHIDSALDKLGAQDVLDLTKLKLGVAKQRDFLVLELQRRRGSLEIKARANLLGGVVNGVPDLDQVGFAHSIKGRHGAR